MNQTFDAKAFMEKAAGYGSVLGLSSITSLMTELHNPQNDLQIIHVAGTNGKGSTCAFLQSVLSKAGYRVGLYTSPAVFSYEERFLVQGKPISETDLVRMLERIAQVCKQLVLRGQPHPTIFEIETALAFLYFKEQACDFVILEVGMGGETDATNVITQSLCSVFASIGRDHMQFLGDSLEEIATMKGGIIKDRGFVYSTWQESTVEDTLRSLAKKRDAKVVFAQKDAVCIHSNNPLVFSYKEFEKIKLSMMGSYQVDNCVLALEVLLGLRSRGFDIPTACIYEGCEETKWPGRMEIISEKPLIYIDGAHNLPAAIRLLETIENNFTNKQITFIIGVLADKEHGEMMRLLLPKASHVITVTSSNPRRLPADDLAKEIAALGFEAGSAASMMQSIDMAQQYDDDMVIAFGSLSYLQEFKQCVMQWTKEHKDV